MPLPVDPTKDAAVEAIAMLAHAGIVADLGAQYLDSMFKEPITLDLIGRKQIPALSIWVHSEQERRRNSSQLVDDLVVMFDYVAPPAGANQRDERWPPLRHVWRAIRKVLHAGSEENLSGGADIMGAASLDVEEGSARVLGYKFLGAEAYPHFRAQMTVMHCPAEVVWSDLDDYLIHFTGWAQPGAADDDPLLADDTTNLPATGS